MALLLKATAFRGSARAPCNALALGHDRALNPVDKPLARIAAISLLRSEATGVNDQYTLARQSAVLERQQARANVFRKRARAGYIETQLYCCRHLVNILPAGTRSTDKALVELPFVE